MWLPNSVVLAMAIDDDYTYIGGHFGAVSPNIGCGVKLSASRVDLDAAFPRVNGPIRACIPDGEGGWYIGGEFTMVGSIIRNRAARINLDGSIH